MQKKIPAYAGAEKCSCSVSHRSDNIPYVDLRGLCDTVSNVRTGVRQSIWEKMSPNTGTVTRCAIGKQPALQSKDRQF